MKKITTISLLCLLTAQVCMGRAIPYSFYIESISPQIDCLEVKHDSIYNNCDEDIILSNKKVIPKLNDGRLVSKEYYNKIRSDSSDFINKLTSVDLDFYNRANFFDSACINNKEYILPNGINFCDKKSVEKYMEEKEFILLKTYQDDFMLGDQKISMKTEFRYFNRNSQNSYKDLKYFVLFAFSVLIVGFLSLIIYTKVKRKLK